ncbi:hypothetical protein UNOSLW4_0050 [Pseudomonas phage UNO-SLW4]|uniref:Uncharacterized protein n=5 Tax=Unosvirus TaxID=3424968 RepID=A0A1B2AN16_9CAUD|nr:hypothetical protein HOS26_gp10 [Pseudomonas phage UNO-SLW1]ANY29025.1 hypothetical protein UNOSLW4_0050 [Pseudomonas phage UNO-SLW4]ANY29071.1 hypothetical protein UNOSLW3_0050 [Pseudomonas phage UNO-SLW3]ANY29118.1 hypothetical protein UNOSLW2_0050 [Pseudomonas phage UNO-SLW2]UBU95706.1 hypothetical protein [Pseudomonas phage PCS4]UPW35204.1 hypothetical protein [Pseudomonas phage PCS5]UZZ63871.1 hypothetical protein PSV6_11 [Pseudomonas phage PSV6]WCD55463.1 hypothetical protein CCNLGM
MNRSNFERIQSTKPRMPEDAAAIFKARKGKRNKTERHARPTWDYGDNHKTNVGAPRGRYAGEDFSYA